jgi:pyruvate dehydrogenase E2 component (dihydrolipoamide acetyltransferase)
MVPVVRDADRKTVVELAAEIAAVVQAARNRTASPEQLTGGTYTVNNLGALGATMGTPIIRSPEVGILGFSAWPWPPPLCAPRPAPSMARPTSPA